MFERPLLMQEATVVASCTLCATANMLALIFISALYNPGWGCFIVHAILRSLLPHRGRGHPLVVRPLGSCSVGRRGTTNICKILFFQIRYVVVKNQVRFNEKDDSPQRRRIVFLAVSLQHIGIKLALWPRLSPLKIVSTIWFRTNCMNTV